MYFYFSVANQAGVESLAHALAMAYPAGDFIASGHTARMLRETGIEAIAPSDITGFPDIADERVSALPLMITTSTPVDYVVCDLAMFPSSLEESITAREGINAIDAGGISLILSAIKAFEQTTVIVDPADYPGVIEELTTLGTVSEEKRKELTLKALTLLADYQALVTDELGEILAAVQEKTERIEDPNQAIWTYEFQQEQKPIPVKPQQGLPFSLHHFNDSSIAYNAVQALPGLSVAFVRNGVLNGCAYAATLSEALETAARKAHVGSTMATNIEVDRRFFETIEDKGIELIIAPSFSPEFVEWAPKNLRYIAMPNGHKGRFIYHGDEGCLFIPAI